MNKGNIGRGNFYKSHSVIIADMNGAGIHMPSPRAIKKRKHDWTYLRVVAVRPCGVPAAKQEAIKKESGS